MNKIMCRLSVPYDTRLLDTHISVPISVDGIKMAEWWRHASKEDRVKIAIAGQKSNDYVEAWIKLAGDSLAPAEAKTDLDLKSTIRRLEEANDAKGDTSPTSEPPATNP